MWVSNVAQPPVERLIGWTRMGMHPNQLVLATPTVRRLVASQFPEWSDLRIVEVPSPGTVNALFRIGDQLVARFPLQPDDPEKVENWIESEAAAARELLGRTRFATPEPVAIGQPGANYPLPWSVQTWVPGVTSEVGDAESVGLAQDLAEFILGVRKINTRGRTFHGRGRGGDLRDHDEWMETCFVQSEEMLDVPPLRLLWKAMRLLPRPDGGDVMNHGDLIATNVLVADGRITGVLDVGGLGPADPALDLLSAWNLLESRPRRTMRQLLASDDLEWARGQAWAFQQAMGLVWYYSDSNPTMSEMGRRTLDRIVGDPQ